MNTDCKSIELCWNFLKIQVSLYFACVWHSWIQKNPGVKELLHQGPSEPNKSWKKSFLIFSKKVLGLRMPLKETSLLVFTKNRKWLFFFFFNKKAILWPTKDTGRHGQPLRASEDPDFPTMFPLQCRSRSESTDKGVPLSGPATALCV